jgi:hypothetical protein
MIDRLIIFIRIVSLIIFFLYLRGNPYIGTLFSPIYILDGKIKDIVEVNYNEGSTYLFYVDYIYNNQEMKLEDDIVFASIYNFKKGDSIKVLFIKKYPEKSYLFVFGNVFMKVLFSILIPSFFLYLFWIKIKIIKKYFS